ncbi:hypothetical protein JXA47_15230 [Candidatus Sumerlaeota bacterium]|nr:hypothetical protein [Candidatus Sumerlaeota bacterium]
MRLIALSLAVALAAFALIAQPDPPATNIEGQVLEVLALREQPTLSDEERQGLESLALSESVELAVAASTALASHGTLTGAARQRAMALALDGNLPPTLRLEVGAAILRDVAALSGEEMSALSGDPLLEPLLGEALSNKTTAEPRPRSQRPLREGCTLIIHGTFANGTANSWWQRGDGFCEHLDDEVGNVWRIVDGEGERVITLYPLSWPSGSPTDAALIAGGALIARHLGELALNDPPPLDIVAHSHGGNVIIRALTTALEENPDLRVRNLVLIGVPHVTVDDALHHWPSDPMHPLYERCERIINIYAPEDTYATSIAGAISPGPIVQTLEPLGVPNATDIAVETAVGCFNAHIVLHSNAMARSIGQALRGELAWAPESFPSIADPNDQGMMP